MPTRSPKSMPDDRVGTGLFRGYKDEVLVGNVWIVILDVRDRLGRGDTTNTND